MPAKTAPAPAAPEVTPTRWGQDRRLEFIDFRLRWEGHLNRGDLKDFFGISTPQASLDLARYTELAPQNLVYDRGARRYVCGADFAPLYSATGMPSKYLNELLAIGTGVLDSSASFLGWQPPLGLMPVPPRQLDIAVVTTLLKAIRERSSVSAVYQSMSRLEPTERVLSPHAIAHDGFRWHVRAYCALRERFLDFVIARMLSASSLEASGKPPEEDADWQNMVSVVLCPNPALSKAHQKAVELDYGMQNGQLELQCRQAMLFYLVQQLRLDQDGTSRPERCQIVLKNTRALSVYLGAELVETTA
jgi:hypothetical protein